MINYGKVDNMGELVILPSTSTGSPHHMHEYAQDAITMVMRTNCLATKNDIVNSINNIIQEMIPREEKIYMSIDKMTDEQKSINSPTEFYKFIKCPRNAITLSLVKIWFTNNFLAKSELAETV
ncbi:hypothetical protein EVAR_34837_1 [Eumeta japonica]|uniref:Uncharacterized protein n=1 Tax=Eumeta variegata TaxID=151549 RepID=A0A4C1YXR8_EUMVA|nr:hypothetical protein EVAR_34837_1 [Eumeta japonica]